MAGKAGKWITMAVSGVGLVVGGPALVYYVMPSEDDLYKNLTPEQRRRMKEKVITQDQHVDAQLKRMQDLSKSDKNIWVAMREDDQQRRRSAAQDSAAMTLPPSRAAAQAKQSLAEREALEKKPKE